MVDGAAMAEGPARRLRKNAAPNTDAVVAKKCFGFWAVMIRKFTWMALNFNRPDYVCYLYSRLNLAVRNVGVPPII